MINRKKIGVLTSSRADYGIYQSLLNFWKSQEWIEVEIIVFGCHLLPEFKSKLDLIKKDSFGFIHVVGDFVKTNTSKDLVKTYSRVIDSFSNFWEYQKYDCLMALGDRFEMSAAIQSTIPFHIPIAHIHGGETTLGAIDNIYRHQISLASEMHFTSTEAYSKRVAKLIGSHENIFNVGSLSLSDLNLDFLKSWDEIATNYKIPKKSFVLVTIHPETELITDFKDELDELSIVFKFLIKKYFLVITGTNSDQNHQSIVNSLKKFCKLNPQHATYINSLGRNNYLSAIYNCSFMLGNSSSGIIEAASFGKYVFNLGKRQNGRLTSKNTFTMPFESELILSSISELEKKGFEYEGENIYFQKNVPEKITSCVKQYLRV